MSPEMDKLLHAGSVDIGRIFDSHDGELRMVEDYLRGMFENEIPLIGIIARHLLDSGGKRMRPLFLLAAARLAGYRGANHIALAGIVECVHTASLLHDDVVDGADIRRGKSSAHSLWGNQTVILVGDYMYSNALRLAVSFGDQKVMEALSAATTRMTQGEILQLERTGDPEIAEDEYLEIISAKTGALISAACRIGGILGGGGQGAEDALGGYGMKAGIAFQMADDILDYMADEKELGKKLGKDIEEGKVTLPLIILLRAADGPELQEIKGLLEGSLSEGGLRRILDLFKRHQALEESVRRARALVESAKEELLFFPPSERRDALADLADYALQRGR